MQYFLILNCFNVLLLLSESLPLIFPGTNWCGQGNVAMHNHDFGWFEDTDMCCRAHDLCSNSIASGKERFSLINDTPFTISDCECDEEFRKCLGKADDEYVELIIKLTFFDLLPHNCFNLVHGKKSDTLIGVMEKTAPFENVLQEYLHDDVVIEALEEMYDEIENEVDHMLDYDSKEDEKAERKRKLSQLSRILLKSLK